MQPNSELCRLKEVGGVIRRTTWSASVTRAKSDAEYASLYEARQECVQTFSGE